MKQLLFAAVSTVVLIACSGRDAREIYSEARAAEDSGKFTVAVERYEEIVRDFPAEAIAETAMYKLVMIRSNSAEDRAVAVEAQRRFLTLFPSSPQAPKVMFMHAFLYNNELRQTDSAKKYYELFLSSWPDHELAPSAKFELETLGKGPDEILEGSEQGAGGAATGRPAGDARE